LPKKEVCFNFLDRLLTFLKDQLRDAQADDVYELTVKSKNSMLIAPTAKLAKVSEDSGIPGWFI